MSRQDVNKVLLEGNLGNDPVFRSPPDGGTPIATASLYTSYSRKGLNNQWETTKERHNLVFFGQLAITARDQYHKGQRLSLEGRLRTRKYEDRTTQLDKYITEVVVNKVVRVDLNAPDQSQPASAAAAG